MELERPKWAYAIATVGAALFTLGMAWLLLSMTSSRPSANSLILWLLGGGSAALGVGWLGMFKQGHTGFGAIGGSFALPIAFAYIYSNRSDWLAMQAHGVMLLLAFFVFAAGHAFVRGLGWVRGFAIISALTMLVQLVAIGAKWRPSAETAKALAYLSFGSLVAIGVTLVIGIPALYTRPRDEHSL